VISIDARNERASVPETSMLKCEQITTLPVADVENDSLGDSLTAQRLREVERGVLRAIGVAV
jgi:hypothetical protein